MDWYRKHSLRIVIEGAHIMADRENEKKYSAETKGYEVRFMPVLERSEYQAGPEREGLIKLQGIMEEKDFEKYINNGLIRITQDGDRLMMISKSEMYRSMLMGKFWSSICEAFGVDNFRVVSQTNGY